MCRWGVLLSLVWVTTFPKSMPNAAFRSNATLEQFPRGAILVNEIMYAPASGEPEWVELANPGPDSVDLRGWMISDAAVLNRHAIASVPLRLKPGGFAVLTRDSAALRRARGNIPSPVVSVSGFPSLNNDGDAIVLYEPFGRTVDSVVFQPVWGGGDGRSLERRDITAPSNSPANWHVSSEPAGATPGLPNAVRLLPHDLELRSASVETTNGRTRFLLTVCNVGCAEAAGARVSILLGSNVETAKRIGSSEIPPLARGDSVVVEVPWPSPLPGIYDPTVVLSDSLDLRAFNDTLHIRCSIPYPAGAVVVNEILSHPSAGNVEYVELYNPGKESVDLQEWRIHDCSFSADRDRRTVMTGKRMMVEPGGFVVLSDDSAFNTIHPDVCHAPHVGVVILRASSLSLNDDADDVVLHDASGGTIDSVSYRRAWHTPAVADPIGRSLERIRPELSSNDPRSWTTSSDRSGGTPGRVNSVFIQSIPSGAALSCYPNPFSPDGDGRDDATMCRYRIPAQVAVISLSVYDVKGRKIRRIADHEPSGAVGALVWDGRTDAGLRAPLGLYVILLEAAGADGASQYKARTVVVLALPL